MGFTSEPGGSTEVLERTETDETTDSQWSTVVYNDPVNTFPYVIACCMRILGCSRDQAETYTNQVHYDGRSRVFTGPKEQAEAYAKAFTSAHLWCRAEKAS